MTRNQYIQLRSNNNFELIVYHYFVEKSIFKSMTLPQFQHLLDYYLNITNINFHTLVDQAIDYYDIKLEIIYIDIEIIKKVKQTVTIVR